MNSDFVWPQDDAAGILLANESDSNISLVPFSCIFIVLVMWMLDSMLPDPTNVALIAESLSPSWYCVSLCDFQRTKSSMQLKPLLWSVDLTKAKVERKLEFERSAKEASLFALYVPNKWKKLPCNQNEITKPNILFPSTTMNARMRCRLSYSWRVKKRNNTIMNNVERWM